MRIRKILMEMVRETSHIISCPRYEAQLRRQGLKDDITVRIHSINPATAVPSDYYEVEDWNEAWREVRQKFGPVVTQLFDAESFRAEFDATVKRDAEGVTPPSAEVVATDHMELCKIKGVHESLAERLFRAGIVSIAHVASASLDELESVQGIGPASAVSIRNNARALSPIVPDEDEPTTTDEPDDATSVDSINPLAAFSPAEE